MRYQDWDVLLFPCGDDAHIPVKEFRTKCYIELPPDGTPNQTPLLTTFVPCLPPGAPFQISVHSWVRTGPMLGVFADGTKPEEFWQVRVVIDGEVIGSKHFDCTSAWPQIVSVIDSPTTLGHPTTQLRFPPFHREIMAENHWNAADRNGRIRVELSAGYLLPKVGRFNKLVDIVSFAFQPTPIDILERCGVAWPNARLLGNPTLNGAYFSGPMTATDITFATKHKRTASTNNVNLPMCSISSQLPRSTSPLNPFINDLDSNYDGSSRSTSVYSIMPDSAAPLLPKGLFHHPAPAYPISFGGTDKTQLSLRLTSDQLQKIINALDSKYQAPQEQPTINPTSAMPPPPLPQHAVTAKAGGDQVNSETTAITQPQTDAGTGEVTSRRGESSYSDISMHANCTSFPTCTSEDTDGRIMHSTPNAPATVVKGKKEGSSSAKPRDFFSTILDTPVAPLPTTTEVPPVRESAGLLSSSPAETQAKKRTRAALKSLNINELSPEKDSVAKPPRKASRSISSTASNKENATDEEDGMLLDA